MLKSGIKCFIKTFLFGSNRFFNEFLVISKLWKDVTHCIDQDIHEFIEERLVKSNGSTITHSATKDSPKNVVTLLVTRHDPVRDGETECPDVVGDDTEGHVDLLLFRLTRGTWFRQSRSVLLSA